MLRYRPDIDGLRALAILPVVLFHANVPGFQGGFVGVDIFFVISGYLITSFIWSEMESGTFSLVRFYIRRARRIFPALFAMILASFIAFSIVMLPPDFRDFSQSVVAASLFSSNILFLLEADYFAAAAETKPLMHTWSLAVEEQFYIFFPLILLWLAGRSRQVLITSLALLSIGSLLLSAYWVQTTPERAFFLLPARMWELALGALAALGAFPHVTSPKLRQALSLVGVGLILSPVFVFSDNTPFPGLAALPPCLGALLLILTGCEQDQPFANRILGQRPLVFIGLISYSLYLWHWPMLVLFRTLGHEISGLTETSAVLGLSVLLAVLSWRYIEAPFRRRGRFLEWRPVFGGSAAVCALLVAMGIFGHVSNGWSARFPDYKRPEIAQRLDKDADRCTLLAVNHPTDWRADPCRLTSAGSSRALLWGDSFAGHLASGFRENREIAPFKTVMYSLTLCPPIFDFSVAERPQCRTFNDRVLSILREENISHVILSANWTAYGQIRRDPAPIARTISKLRDEGYSVTIIAQSPILRYSHPYDAVYLGFDQVPNTADPDFNDRLGRLLGLDIVFDPTSTLCPENLCPLRAGDNYIFSDYGHLSPSGSSQVVKALFDYLSGQDLRAYVDHRLTSINGQ